jgi:hypothetical protein
LVESVVYVDLRGNFDLAHFQNRTSSQCLHKM